MECRLCPRECGADRQKNAGFCGATELPLVARAALHFWEEPPISGTKGSGAVFFSGCNLRCIFCQNMDISAARKGTPCDAEKLCGLYFKLFEQGAHNINLVTPSIHVPELVKSIELAKARGFSLPFVWNTNAYEKAETLKRLEGLVDIYLPDIKYVSPQLSGMFSGAPDYFEYASKAVLEMQRQTGTLTLNQDGVASRGVLIRHMVLPCCAEDTRRVLDFVAAELPKETYMGVMRQYVPMYSAVGHKTIGRRVTSREYKSAVEYARSLGLHNIYTQSKEAADTAFTPPFDGTGL